MSNTISKPNPFANMTLEQIGDSVSVALCWDGQAIFDAMIAALTDANFHQAVKALKITWQETLN